MFHPKLQELIDAQVPEINPLIGDGLAVAHLDKINENLDLVFRTGAESENNGLRYLGFKRCTPEEEYRFITRKRGTRVCYDIAENYFTATCFIFQATNEVGVTQNFERIILVPFVEQGGLMRINHARYRISPIMSDRVISVNSNDVFIRLLKAKITFRRLIQTYRGDGRDELIQITWANIYNDKTNEKKAASKPVTPMALYLLCKYGFNKAMHKVSGAMAVIVSYGMSSEGQPEEHYQNEDWVCCQSSEIAPKGSKGYRAPHMKIYVRRSDYNPMAKQMVASIFYVADRYYYRFDHQATNMADARFWQVLLGLIIRRINDVRSDATISDGKIIEDMRDHMVSLDEYLDSMYKERLKQDGYDCDTIYDMFVVIMQNLDHWLAFSASAVTSKYGKEVSILYDACFGLISAVNRMYYKLRNLAKRDRNGKPIGMTDYEELLREFLPPTVISRQLGKRPVASGVTYPGDCLLAKITTELIPQHQANATGRRIEVNVTNNPTLKLDASAATVTNFGVLSKADETGCTRLNPWVHLDQRSVIVRDPKYDALIEKTQRIITGAA